MPRFVSAIFLFLACLLAPLSAQFGGFGLPGDGDSDAGKSVTVGLVSGVKSVAPGSKFLVGVTLDHAPGWHTYWKNPGGFSLPVEITWELPAGFKVLSTRWPVPTRYISQGFPAYINPDHSVIVCEIEAPADLKEGDSIAIKAQVEGQVCKDSCELFDQSAGATLTAAASSSPDEGGAKTIAGALAALAKPLQGWTATASESSGPGGGTVTLRLTPGDGAATVTKAHFFSHLPGQINDQADQTVKVENGILTLTLPRPEAEEGTKEKPAPVLSGILVAEGGWLKENPATTAMEIEITIGEKAAASTPADAQPLTLVMIGIAFLGGLILNLMPCVFPVLGLKIMNFVNQAGEDHRKVVMHGIIFTAGVLISFWALAGVVIAVKHFTGNENLAWGFQLQDARFVLIMALVLFLFSLSLAGLFEFGTSATSIGGNLTRKSGLSGSFFSGVLATLVATPCAAPFLAPALGAALSMPALPSLVLFTAIALGLALPYLVLSAFPKLVDLLPRPGAWMETFKKLMSFPMFATVAWLIWVLGQQVDTDKFLHVLFAFTLAALAVYIFGQWGQAWRKNGTKWSARAACMLLLATSTAMAWPGEDKQLVWEPWSPERVAELREKNIPVFIDFTAAWCATCKANKLRYTHDTTVIDLAEKKGVVALKADFTRKDPVIEKAIAGYGKRAVPVNVLYAPGATEPAFLPELFGADEVISRFSALPDKGTR